MPKTESLLDQVLNQSQIFVNREPRTVFVDPFKSAIKLLELFTGTAGALARNERAARTIFEGQGYAPDGAFAGEGARDPSEELEC